MMRTIPSYPGYTEQPSHSTRLLALVMAAVPVRVVRWRYNVWGVVVMVGIRGGGGAGERSGAGGGG